jgi:hypothetical protein
MLVSYFLLRSLWHSPLYFLFMAPCAIIFSDTKEMVNKLEEFGGTIYWRRNGSLKSGTARYVRIAPRPEWLNAYSSHEISFGCSAMTRAGYPCSNHADHGSELCRTHLAMQENYA